MTTLIKVYEDSDDFQYEQYFFVDITKEEKEKLLKVCDDIRDLDYDERETKYGSESVIDCVENYIVKNLKKVDYERIDINTH